jgi:BRCT domain type II-containing protein
VRPHSYLRRKGLKLPGRTAEKSTPASAKAKNARRYTSSSQMSSWHGAIKHSDKFVFIIVKIFIEKVVFIQTRTNATPL